MTLDLDAIERDYQTPALRNNVPTSVALALIAEIRRLRDGLEPRTRLPLHRTDAQPGVRCSTCDGGGCLDCTDPA